LRRPRNLDPLLGAVEEEDVSNWPLKSITTGMMLFWIVVPWRVPVMEAVG
jgi:hypothetical protein